MDGTTLGIIGGVTGAALGLLGGVIGTWASVRSTRTPAERRFMIRAAAALWVALLLLIGAPAGLAALGVVPAWLTWVPMTAAFVALGPFIRWANARQALLRGDPRRGARAAGAGPDAA